MRKPKIPLAYSYLRFSSPQQATGDSIRRQTEAREKWLAEHPGIELDKSLVLTDAGRSAFKRQDRATYALARVVDHIKSGRVEPGSYLLVENLDRLSREDAGTATELFLTIVNHGVIVVQLLPMVMEFKKPVNRQALMFAIVELSRGNSESAARSERVGAAWARRIKEARSRVVTRRLPNWIDHHDGKLALNPEKARIVRRVFDLALNGDGVTAIAHKLNAQHGPRGAPRPHEARPGGPGGRGGRGGSRDGGGLKLTACCSASPLPSSDTARPVGLPEARPDRVARPLDRGGPGSFAAGRMGRVSGECGIGRGVRARTEAVAIVTRRASAQFLRLVHFVQLDRQRRCYTILKAWSYPTFPRQRVDRRDVRTGRIRAVAAASGEVEWESRGCPL